MIFNQVTKIFSTSKVIGNCFRLCKSFTVTRNYSVLVPLISRRLLKVFGSDASSFLQGLITNDMRHLEEGAKSMYAMFLNNKGRILFDTLIYKWDGENNFLIECHKDVLVPLQNNLKIYKLKRDVKIQDVNKDFKVWALLSNDMIFPELRFDPTSDINILNDPRVPELGCRILSAPYFKGDQLAHLLGDDINADESEAVYTYLRYRLGICEGAEDLPPGKCLPLEVNCDYLHGVSFHKGCYIGQELTARVYHTGVVRKRIMPLKFIDIPDMEIPIDTIIKPAESAQGISENLGKFKGQMHDHGIGLLRIREVLQQKYLRVGNYTVEVLKPSWWPVEAPKEIVKEEELETST